MYREHTEIPEMKFLRPLEVGHNVRILLLTRKQQLDTSQKGFRPKWSRKVYTVLRKTALQLNPNNFRYYVGSSQSYYRHELLVVPRITDSQVPQGYIRHQQNIIAEDEEWEDEGFDSDDSRA